MIFIIHISQFLPYLVRNFAIYEQNTQWIRQYAENALPELQRSRNVYESESVYT